MRLDELIEMVPGVCAGQPVVRGTRLPVRFVYEMLDEGWTPEEVVRYHYPFLSLEVVRGLIEHREAIESLIEEWEERWRKRIEGLGSPKVQASTGR